MTDSAVHKGGKNGGDTSLSLLDKAREKDQTAWERLVHLYQPLLARWCSRANVSEADALDITQEVFAAVSLKLGEFERKKEGSFRSWLKTITRNKIVDHLRQIGSGPAAGGGTDAKNRMENLPESEAYSLHENDAPEEQGIVYRKALDLIKTEFEANTWQAFMETIVGSRSAADVAADLGMTRTAVYTAKSRVLKRLRDEFKDLLDDS